MDWFVQNGLKRRWLVSVVSISLVFSLCGATVSAVRGATSHKSLSRLKAGLKGVRESQEKAQVRLKELKKRQNVLESKLEQKIYPKTIPSIQQSIRIVREEIEGVPDKPKAIHKKLLALLDDGHQNVLCLIAGSTYSSAEALSKSNVRHVLLAFDTKQDVLDAIDKVDNANQAPSPKTAKLAKAELKKIQFERKALVKKIHKCELDEKTILAEIEVVQEGEPAEKDAEFIKPIPGRVTSGFGPRMHPIDNIEKEHKGIDLAGAVGDTVKSSATGKVIFAGEQRGYGNIVIVQHSETMCTAYGHLSQIDVAVGEEVTQGRKIGEVGMTGNTTGPHLHFEIRENGEQVDPIKYL